jgi:triosephosphate isomerase
MDCGCFGEAIHLTHMQTFLKNLVLLALLLAYMLPLKHLMIDTKKRKYVVFYLVGISTLAFTIYSWIYIPMVDFTAYKPGAELSAGADINPEDMYESVFTYEKDGVQETFTLEDLPQDIDTWTFVSTETRTKNDQAKDLIELSFYKAETGEYMDTLATEGKVMIVSVYDTDMNEGRWKEVEDFISRAQEKEFTALLLCAQEDGIPENMKDFAYISDYKTLISMNRSNGGVTYFNDGVLIRKWARICAPDPDELEEIMITDSTEVSIARESKGSLVFQGFLLYVFAVMLLL